jgi:hypothetical protein
VNVSLADPVRPDHLHVPILVKEGLNSNGLFKFHSSNKWVPSPRAKTDVKKIPYIDRNGDMHAVSIAYWRCDAYQMFSSLSSTVYKRLIGNVRKRIPIKKRCTPDLLLKISLMYTLDNNDSWFRRCKGMLFSSKTKQLRDFVYYSYKHLDQTKRFLVDQAMNFALWFQFRQRIPRSRDRSKSCVANDSTLTSFSHVGSFERSQLSHSLNDLMSRWCSVYRTSVGDILTVDSVQWTKSMSVFRG